MSNPFTRKKRHQKRKQIKHILDVQEKEFLKQFDQLKMDVDCKIREVKNNFVEIYERIDNVQKDLNR